MIEVLQDNNQEKQEYNGNVVLSITHQFDTGAAWENLALEAVTRGLVAHGMAGFDYENARKDLDIPNGEHGVMANAKLLKRQE
jgi:hypothetical protein